MTDPELIRQNALFRQAQKSIGGELETLCELVKEFHPDLGIDEKSFKENVLPLFDVIRFIHYRMEDVEKDWGEEEEYRYRRKNFGV